MLVEGGPTLRSANSNGVPSSILDSPTLARVERAMLRHEQGTNSSLHRAAFTQSLLPSNFGKESGHHAIKKGLLWQQRDRLFSRWKERYFILTRDYLHCFRRASGTDRISEMGQFLFKIKLADVDKIQWLNKKTYSTVALELGREGGRLLLRAPEELEDWFEMLERCMLTSKERRRALRHSHDIGKPNNNNSINSNLEDWLLTGHQKMPGGRLSTDTVSTTTREATVIGRRRDYKWEKPQDEDPWLYGRDNMDNNRLSLLTDIDISSYDSTLGAPSVASYRMNEDVYCVSRGGPLRSSGSFRIPKMATTNNNGNNKTRKECLDNGPQLIKFRERSHSDIQRIDRRPWRFNN